MESMRVKAKSLVKKRHGKTIKKSLVDRIWKDYCEIAIFKPLIKYGKVEIDGMKIEIVGRSVADKRYNGKIKDFNACVLSKMRPSVIYKIEMTDSSYKGGKLMFKASDVLKRKVKDSLTNTTNYYRIEQ